MTFELFEHKKKALNSKDEPVLFLHFTGNLAKNQF